MQQGATRPSGTTARVPRRSLDDSSRRAFAGERHFLGAGGRRLYQFRQSNVNAAALREILEFQGSPNLDGNKLRAIGVIMCVM